MKNLAHLLHTNADCAIVPSRTVKRSCVILPPPDANPSRRLRRTGIADASRYANCFIHAYIYTKNDYRQARQAGSSSRRVCEVSTQRYANRNDVVTSGTERRERYSEKHFMIPGVTRHYTHTHTHTTRARARAHTHRNVCAAVHLRRQRDRSAVKCTASLAHLLPLAGE